MHGGQKRTTTYTTRFAPLLASISPPWSASSSASLASPSPWRGGTDSTEQGESSEATRKVSGYDESQRGQ